MNIQQPFRKALVILSPGFATSEADDTCLPFLQNHILALNKCFPDVEIIVAAFQYPHFKGEYHWHGNRVICFGGEGREKLWRLMLWAQVWKKLRQVRRSRDIAGVLSVWCTECALVGRRFGRRYGVQHLVWICGQDALGNNGYVKKIQPAGSELIAVSDFIRREFLKNHGIEPAYVIPVGVDPEQFAAGNKTRDIDVLGAGSLIPLKQYDVFVEVVTELVQTFPTLKTIICGKGPEEERISAMIAERGLQRNIILAGEMQHDRVACLMQRTKIFLHPSGYEGFGLVHLEALSAGAQVVGCTKAMDEDIPHWRHAGSKEEMAAIVKELLQNRELCHKPVVPYPVAEMAAKMFRLFQREP